MRVLRGHTLLGRTAESGQLRYEARQERDGLFLLPAVLALLSAAALAVRLPGSARYAAVVIFLLMLGGLLLLVHRGTSRRTVLIDRASGIIRVTGTGPFRRGRTVRQLLGPLRVMVREHRTPLDAGYHLARYSVVIREGRQRFELLTTGDEHEALAVCDEIALLLRPRTGSHPEDAA